MVVCGEGDGRRGERGKRGEIGLDLSESLEIEKKVEKGRRGEWVEKGE